MTRQEELNEFGAILQTLLKKYNVNLGINIVDLNSKEETPSQSEEVKTE